METIRFYYKGELVGKDRLPECTGVKDRHRIAKFAGVKIYDKAEFVKENGEVRLMICPDTVLRSTEFNVAIA